MLGIKHALRIQWANMTQSELLTLLEYNPETGLIKYKNPAWNQCKDWFPGLLGSHGYYMIQYKRKSYLVHRLAYLYMVGKFPVEVIDHINSNKKDNTWKNIRDASYTQNALYKTKASRNSKSGILGVTPHRDGFTAQCKVQGKKIHLGKYKTKEEAEEAYLYFKNAINIM